MPRKLTDRVHLRLRFDEKLRRRLERAADENKHSMNAEIIDRLEKSFAKQDEAKLLDAVTTTNSEVKALRLEVERLIPFEQRTAVPASEPRPKEHRPQEKPESEKDRGT